MTGFRKFNTGDPLAIAADDYNAAMDAARWYAQNRGSDGFDSSNPIKQAGTIMVQNNGSAITAPGGVLGIDSPLVLPTANLTQFQSNLALQCSTPNTSKHVGKFVVTLGPANPGKLVRAVLSGYVAVQISMNASTDKFADISNGTQGYLQSGSSGAAQILWTEGMSGTSPQWAVARIGLPANIGTFACTLGSGGCSARSGTTLGSGTATLCTLAVSSGTASYTATSTTFTVYTNSLTSLPQKTPSTTQTILYFGEYINGVPVITVGDCTS